MIDKYYYCSYIELKMHSTRKNIVEYNIYLQYDAYFVMVKTQSTNYYIPII